MTTNDSLKKKIVVWANRQGHPEAIVRFKRAGVSERMAYYLISGTYKPNLSLKKAAQIMKAMK